MPIKTIPLQFKTSDGREFDSLEAAERHEKFIEIEGAYKAARMQYTKHVLETQRTADNKPFSISNHHTYYCIHRNAKPWLGWLSFFLWDVEIDDEDTAVIYHKHDNGNRIRYSVNELYYHKRKAQLALLEALRTYVSDVQEDIDDLAKELGLE